MLSVKKNNIPKRLQLFKRLSCIFMSILTCFFLALIPYTTSITFNFTNITPKDSQDIIFSGDAVYTFEDGIQVTHNMSINDSTNLAGQATYIRRLHLWDNDSTDLASFSTSFELVIDSYGSKRFGDGLTFFLAQNNSVMKAGGTIGLPFNNVTNTNIYPFVAVEFDTFGSNDWDPKDPNTSEFIDEHVGININSLTSVRHKKWDSKLRSSNVFIGRVLINYFSDSKILTVSFTGFNNSLDVGETGLNYTIDLRDVLPEWVVFGFSASTGDRFEKNIVRSWMFNSTELNIDENTVLPPTRSPNVVKGAINSLGKMGLIVGTLVLVSVLAIFLYFLWRKKKSNGDKVKEIGYALEMSKEFEMGAIIPRRFSYYELARSTANFAETEKLGEGGFGGVYKGFLKDLSMYVAVKRVSKTSKQGMKEYASEVRIISRLRHKNLVQLVGWSHEKGELLLAYEYMENGSLDLHLFKGKSLLSWNARYKIVHGLASALLYLHEECEQCVLHRDIKSSNVMLDSNFNAKLGDFGLAKLVDHENGSETTMVAGTIGYMSPEYITTGKPSKESDVFSFGVVALEITCGRKPILQHVEERKTKLVEWVWNLYGTGTLLEAADPCLGLNFVEEEMMSLMIVGLWCAHPDSKLRPSMKQAIQALNSEASLPLLPSNMPDVTYSALPHFSLYCETLSGDSNKHSTKLSTSSTTYQSLYSKIEVVHI